ncbi:MAG: CBS domain-containing protein [Paracoccus sp. (in: a-proteobacteria)]|nr:CBS domain-containing protein [Paracoccus sp. (in: a-proteobacteria)]
MTDRPEIIDDVMRRDFLRLGPDMPIREAAAALVRDGWSGAPVIDDQGALIGMLTQKDCFRPALNASYYRQWTGTVRDRMSGAPLTIEAGGDLVSAAEMFLEHPHRLFPVLRGSRVEGVLRRSDLLAALLRLG